MIRRVLLVEDDRYNARVTKRMLDALGCAVKVAVDGLEAVSACAAEDFDLVLMDWELPRLDGLAATRAIRASGAKIPIVAMTAHATPADRDLCIAAGMDGLLAKPASMRELSETIEQFDRPELDALDDTLARSAGDSVAILRELSKIFVEDARRRAHAVIDAHERGSAAEVRANAHALRGASEAFGASRLAARCGRIESAAKRGALAEMREDVALLVGEMVEVEHLAHARGWLST